MSTLQHTDQFYAYNTQGQLALVAAPSAVTGYSDSYADLLHNVNGSYQYLNNTSGLITRYDYYTTTTARRDDGGRRGQLSARRADPAGPAGTLIPQETWQYYAHGFNGQTIAPVATDTVYRNSDGTGAETTSFAYTWAAGTAHMLSETDTAPVDFGGAEWSGHGGRDDDVLRRLRQRAMGQRPRRLHSLLRLRSGDGRGADEHRRCQHGADAASS